MLNIIWPVFLISSFIYSIYSGKILEVNNAIFNSTKNAVDLSISLLGNMCLWSGLMQIANQTTVIEKINKILKPIIDNLFPDVKNNSKIKKEISMNIIANILGLGNASTPLGLKAMKSMQEENNKKSELSNSMIMFIVINTASIQIIPTTIIAIRNSLGSENPTKIIIPVWVSTICAAFGAIIVCKILIKKFK